MSSIAAPKPRYGIARLLSENVAEADRLVEERRVHEVEAPFIGSDKMREMCFMAMPDYEQLKDNACYTKWATGRKFDGCKLTCNCPRKKIPQEDVDAFRDRLTTQYINEFNANMMAAFRDQSNVGLNNVCELSMCRLKTVSQRGLDYLTMITTCKAVSS